MSLLLLVNPLINDFHGNGIHAFHMLCCISKHDVSASHMPIGATHRKDSGLSGGCTVIRAVYCSRFGAFVVLGNFTGNFCISASKDHSRQGKWATKVVQLQDFSSSQKKPRKVVT
eukprot:1410670-Ditylum_brightwellii.AAC.1